MTSCRDCSSRVVWYHGIGNMDKCKFILCGFRPKLRMKPKTVPKWCPRIDELEKKGDKE